MHSGRVVLLGPQRLHRTLSSAVESLRVHGMVAAVTAGWEEREGEDQEMREHLGGRTVNLKIWERAEDVMTRDPELSRALRERHDRLREQHALYRLRLDFAVEAARELMRREPTPGREEMLEAERAAAIEAVRELDEFHLRRVSLIHREFEAEWRPTEREVVARHRHELAQIVESCECVCVAGGHVVVLLHRLRLFDLLPLLAHRPLVAWSAGAMALGERVVLFHDSPPQGQGAAELHEEGLGAYSGVLPFPHAKKRLRLHDRRRIAFLARRFAPDRCLALDPLTRADWDGRRWHGEPGTLRLHEEGMLVQAGAP
ncbi:MAG: hypothetical protein JNK02_17630 [Planctomycetes bacterium]|nr:hypothetical protein [Planctomycetota bacterium]